MKKNRTLKLASGLLILCLITTCAISTTLAKYTTGGSAADTARVAKWGVEVSASGTMFGTAYQDTIVKNGDANATVQSNFNPSYLANVVAPGTKNETGIQIKIFGQPEVAFNLSAEVTQAAKDIYLKAGTYGAMVVAYGVNEATDFVARDLYTFAADKYTKATVYEAGKTYYELKYVVTLANTYYPISWNASVSVDGSMFVQSPAFPTLEAALTNLVAGINNYDGTAGDGGFFKPNTLVNLTYNLNWAWNFSVNDAADTILGNLMAKDQGTISATTFMVQKSGAEYIAIQSEQYNLIVGGGFSVTATQVD